MLVMGVNGQLLQIRQLQQRVWAMQGQLYLPVEVCSLATEALYCWSPPTATPLRFLLCWL